MSNGKFPQPQAGKPAPPPGRFELRARALAWTKEQNLTRADFADQLGYSRAAISKYLDGVYENTANIEAALHAFFSKQDRLAGGRLFVDTRVAGLVMESCQYAFEQRKLVVIYGPAGNGKTTAAQEFLRRKIADGIRNLVFVTANSTTTPASLVRRIAEELGISSRATTPDLLERVLARLKRDPHLVVVDDASFLSVKALEALRYLYDQAACGIALLGTKTLMERIFNATGRLAEDLEQLYSRVDLQKLLPDALTKRERKEMVRRRAPNFGDEAIAAVAGRQRRARALTKVLERVRYIQPLNPQASAQELVAEAEREIFEASA